MTESVLLVGAEHADHLPADLWDALTKKQLKRILYWVCNQNQSWASIPYYDWRFLFAGGWRMLRKVMRLCLREREA